MRDALTSAVPTFSHEIWVRWPDCDPARIAYTGRLPAMALEAIEAWWQARLGLDWYEMVVDRDIGLPFVHMSMDYRAPVTPRHRLLIEVRLTRLGRSSVRFAVRGLQSGRLCFEGEFVEAAVAAARLETIPLPDEFRAKLEPLVEPAGEGASRKGGTAPRPALSPKSRSGKEGDA